MEHALTVDSIHAARAALGDDVRTTPIWEWKSDAVRETLGTDTSLVLKLELLQYAGSFKPRGALTVMRNLSREALDAGVTALSGGNHAIAVAYAARVVGTTAKVVIPRTASAVRIERCRALGAEVVLVEDVHEAFRRVHEIEASEGRTFVHPFEGPYTALGNATLGLELMEQTASAPLDAVVVSVGGGGLIAGVAAAVKLTRPACVVYAVEPEGADTLFRSFQSGEPEALDRVRTIADSLGAPHAAPYSLALCRQYVDEVVLVDDDAMCRAMALMFSDLKLACEPAGAAATAAVWGPLRERLLGKRVGIVVCGSNIDAPTFASYVARGEASRATERGSTA